MKRVLSLVLALVLVLGMIPTFAADMTAGQHLFEHEFIAGDGMGNLNEDQLLTREQLAKLILELNGSKEEAEALTLPPSFTDSAKISAWARPYVAYAQIEGLMVGFTDGSFRPQEGVSGQQLAAVLTRALGYEFEWATVVADAADLGIDVAVAAKLTRGQAFEAMWTTVNTNPKDGDKPLGVVLGKLVDTTPVVPTTLEVTSVTATNLKEIVVKFNQAVDKATVLAANFSLSPAAGALTPVLGEDGMTVTITTASAMTNQGAYKLTAEKVATAAEVKLAKVVKDFTAFDATLPTVESIEVTGPKTFDIIFSEPITTTGTVTVKSANTTLAVQTAAADDSNVVSVTLFTSLVDGTTYDVTVKDYADAAGYKNVIKTIAYTYTKDATAPTISVVSANQQYVVLKFNKPVTGISKANFYHTFSAWTPMEIYKTKAAMDAGTGAITTGTTDVTTVYVQFATTGAAGQFPLQPGTVNVNVLGKVGSVEVKDNWGNAFASTVVPVTVAADLEAPTVTKVEATSNTNIAVTFSKAVNPGTTANYEVLKSDGTAISGLTFTVSAASTTKVNLALSKSLLGETVIVNVKNIEDTTLNKNKLAATSTTTITFADKEFAGVTRAEFDATNKLLYVTFAENMGPSAIEIANYKLDDGGTVRTLAGPISFFNGSKVVKIELSATEAAYVTTTTDNVLISNAVKDVAGNGPTTFQLTQQIVAIGTGAAIPGLHADGVRAIDKNSITVQFNQELVSVDPLEFAMKVAAGAYERAVGVELTNNTKGSLVKLTFASDIPANVAQVELISTAATGGIAPAVFTNTKNIFGVVPAQLNAAQADNVLDYIVPTIVTNGVETVDLDSDGKIDHIKVTFSEAMQQLFVSPDKFTVTGYTVLDAYLITGGTPTATGRGTATVADSATLHIRVEEKTATDGGATPTLSIAAGLRDVAENSFAAVTSKASVDKVLPVLLSAKTLTNNTIELTYTEAVNIETAATGRFTLDLDGAGAGAAVNENAAPSVVDGKVVLTFTGAFATTVADADAIIAYTAAAAGNVANVQDAAGNEAATVNLTGFTSGY